MPPPVLSPLLILVAAMHRGGHAESGESENACGARGVKTPVTFFQISAITTLDDRIWVLGRVLSGEIKAGDTLEAVGLDQIACTIGEIKVDGVARPAVSGERSGHSCLRERSEQGRFFRPAPEPTSRS